MAQRRMFSLKVIDTDEFLDMPQTTQLLYYNLAMRADDDGFVSNPKKIMRMSGCNDDDIKVLFLKKFVIPFENGICVIRHWRIHNYIQSDRYCQTEYLKEKAQLLIINNKYELKNNTKGLPNGNQMTTNGIPNVYKMDTQDRLGKDRLGKKEVGKADNILLNELTKYYCDLVLSLKGYSPKIGAADIKTLKSFLKENTKEEIKRIFDWYVGTEKFKEWENLKNALSIDSINKYRKHQVSQNW